MSFGCGAVILVIGLKRQQGTEASEGGQLRCDAAPRLAPEFIGLFGAVLCQVRSWTSVTSNQLPVPERGMARGPS